MEEVLKEMPAFQENRESAPEACLREKLEAAEKGALGNEKRAVNAIDGDNSGSVDETSSPTSTTRPSSPPVVNDLLDVGDDHDYYAQQPPAPPATTAVST